VPSAVKEQAKEKAAEAAGYRARLYDRYRSAQGYASIDDRAARAPYLRRLIARHFPPDREAQILDLGCGGGTLIYFLREAGYRQALGVDASPEQVAAARALNIPGIRQGELIETLRAAGDDSLDVVVAFDLIEHLTKPELLALADEVHRALKPQGRWIIHAPNAESPFGARVRYSDWTHEQAFTKESLGQLLRAVGFARVQCYEDQPTVHGVKSALRWLVWKAARGLLRLYWAAETGSAGRDCLFSQNLLAVGIKE
jgi:2-polyprenyl-3-methyl-5-hydroxy-6-metoxy-1,4-benzoquinol methylase